jgi:hypothetical protein
MPLNRLVDSGQQIVPPPDVQRTTLGVDALSRFVCNTWDEATANGTRHFDAVVIGAGMFGGYCAEKIYRLGQAQGLKVLILDAGPFLVPTHVQNLPRIGLNVPGPLFPANDPGVPREVVWGMAWRGNVPFFGQAYCIGGKSPYWGGWCPRLLASDLSAWPPTVAAYLNNHYPILEQQTGVDVKTDFIQGPLFNLLKGKVAGAIGTVANIDTAEDPPLAVQGEAPGSGLFSFDKYSTTTLVIDAAREASGQPDDQRRFFVVPNAHVTRIHTTGGAASSIDVVVNGAPQSLAVSPACPVILALGTIESTRLALVSFPTSPDNPAAEFVARLLSFWVGKNPAVVARFFLLPFRYFETTFTLNRLFTLNR